MSEALRVVLIAAERLELCGRYTALNEQVEELLLPELREHANDDVKQLLVELRVLGVELWERLGP